MLKIRINKNGGGPSVIEAQGSMLEITSDIAHVINDIYTQVKQSDSIQALLFKEAITQLVTSENTPLWEQQGESVGFCFAVPNKSKEEM